MDKNNIISFIDEVDREQREQKSVAAFHNTPVYKSRVLEGNKEKAKETCLNYILSDFYKRSLPLAEDYIQANSDQIGTDMKDFINKQTADQGLLCYVREGIKRGNRSLNQIMESVNRLVDDCFREKAKEVEKLSAEDLDWRFDDDKKAACDQISKDANLDEVADYVKKNVEAAANYEKAKIKEKHEEKKALEEELSKNPELTSESAVNAYLIKTGRHHMVSSQKSIYQPSLFEGVMMSKFNHLTSESEEDKQACYNEAVKEYTLLNMNKALRIKDYSLNDMRSLAKQYAAL